MAFLDQLRQQREGLIAEAEQIKTSLDNISQLDPDGNAASALSQDTIDTLIERSTQINDEIDRMDNDIKELDRQAAIRSRTKDCRRSRVSSLRRNGLCPVSTARTGWRARA